MQTLAYSIPAATAALAYLNARSGFTYDLPWIKTVVQVLRARNAYIRNDELNTFYALEQQAHSSRRDHTWIIFEGKHYSFEYAYETVLKFGTWLKSKGVKRHDVVAMDIVNSPLFIWIWFGLWSIGATPAFVNTNLSGEPLIHTIRTSTARLVIVDLEGKDKFAESVMAEHGFFARSPKVANRNHARDHVSEHDATTTAETASTERARLQEASRPTNEQGPHGEEKRRVEFVFFDQGLEDHIASLRSIRQPNSERSVAKMSDQALLIYTSGTTGLPKPAILSWSKASIGPKYVSEWLPLNENDVMYTSMPLYHSAASIFTVVATLRAGCTASIGRKFSHKLFWPEVRASKATVIQYVGETCRYLLSAPESSLDKAHAVRLAFGNGMRPDVWETFKERFNVSTVLEFYGATESPSILANRSTNKFSSGAIGRNGALGAFVLGLSTTLVKIDPDSEFLDPLRDIDTGLCKLAGHDEPGELMFKLDPNDIHDKFQGYFNNSRASNAKIIRNVKQKGDAWYRTGDLMRRDKERRWYFLDRLGDTFRWKSENVSTAEVADALGKHEAIAEASVYGVEVPHHDGRAGCAAIVLKKTEKPSNAKPMEELDAVIRNSLAEHVKSSLPTYAVPLFLRLTKQMHTTGTNKQQKHVFQKDGIDVASVEGTGDLLYWLKDGSYEKFTGRELGELKDGTSKL